MERQMLSADLVDKTGIDMDMGEDTSAADGDCERRDDSGTTDANSNSTSNSSVSSDLPGQIARVQAQDDPNPTKVTMSEVVDIIPADVHKLPASVRCLQNSLIWPQVVGRLPPKTLLQLREVCPTWNEDFVLELREKHTPIKISSVLKTKDTTEQFKNHTVVMLESQYMPFAKYDVALEACPLTLELFNMCGDWMTSLSICAGYDSRFQVNVHMLRQIVFDKAPSLKNFELNICIHGQVLDVNEATPPSRELPELTNLTFKWLEYHTAIQNLFEDLIHNATNLESLSVATLGRHEGGGAVVSSLSRSPHLLSNLKGMKILDLGRSHMESLAALATREENPLRLERLTILQYWPVDLYNFLRANSSTLRQLELRLDKFSSAVLRLPQLDQLFEFALTGEGFTELDLEFEFRTLEENFPNLKSFEFNQVSTRGEPILDVLGNPNLIRHAGVTELKFNTACTILENLPELGRLYPLVVHAELQLEGKLDSFAAIWTTWSSLQTLHLDCKAYPYRSVLELDELLSGIPASSFHALEDDLKSQDQLTLQYLHDLWLKYKAKPSLGDLCFLRKLTINANHQHCDNSDHFCNVSDIGGYFGFANGLIRFGFTNLQFLTLKTASHIKTRHADKPKTFRGNTISTECRAFIRSVLGVAAVIELE